MESDKQKYTGKEALSTSPNIKATKTSNKKVKQNTNCRRRRQRTYSTAVFPHFKRTRASNFSVLSPATFAVSVKHTKPVTDKFKKPLAASLGCSRFPRGSFGSSLITLDLKSLLWCPSWKNKNTNHHRRCSCTASVSTTVLCAACGNTSPSLCSRITAAFLSTTGRQHWAVAGKMEAIWDKDPSKPGSSQLDEIAKYIGEETLQHSDVYQPDWKVMARNIMVIIRVITWK